MCSHAHALPSAKILNAQKAGQQMKIAESHLRSIIRETLSLSLLLEKSRYEKETGEKYNPQKEIQTLVTEHPCEYAFTMTSLNKVGVNPGTSYNTPAGVYCYPLDSVHYRALIENNLPFVSEAKYCSVVKLQGLAGPKWLKFSDIPALREPNEMWGSVLDKLLVELPKSVIERAKFQGRNFSKPGATQADKIFDLTYFATKSSDRPTVRWSALLRKLGFIGLYDTGMSVIHESEPAQLVCLSPEAYTLVKTYKTSELRKTHGFSRESARKASRNPKSSPEVIERLANTPGLPPDVYMGLAEHPKISSKALKNMLELPGETHDSYTLTRFFLSPKATPEILMKLLDLASFGLYMSFARHVWKKENVATLEVLKKAFEQKGDILPWNVRSLLERSDAYEVFKLLMDTRPKNEVARIVLALDKAALDRGVSNGQEPLLTKQMRELFLSKIA